MSLITIGIPVFNAMPYLPESLESILRQTYNDFEILIVNDGSKDGSRDYLRTVKDRRLRVIDQTNQGITVALNRMLSEANTPWLARHDADDVAYPNRIARAAQFIERYPDAGMFYSLADYYPKGSVGQFRATKATPAEIRKLVLSGYLPAICHPTVTLNVKRAAEVGGYRFNLHVEDIDLWWRLALAHDVLLIPEVAVGFRQNLGSVSSAHLAQQAINTLYIQYLLLSHLWSLKPLPYEEARAALTHLFDHRKLAFKAHLRAFNMAMGERDHLRALMELGQACLASPVDFSRRLLDEAADRRQIALGESPQNFRRFQKLLWPTDRTSQPSVQSNAPDSLELSIAQTDPKA
jgi:glycosyltransferase involved in cell wall biosynthesis